MAKLGRINTLKILEIDAYGAMLDADDLGHIMVHNRTLSQQYKAGDEISVFLYLDSNERLCASTRPVKAQVGEVAYLKAAQVNKFGAFLDWGIEKDLLVPFNQQQTPIRDGNHCLVYIYIDDNSGRIVASTKLNKFIYHEADGYKKGQAVDLIISDKTDIGYSAVINHQHWGVLFYGDVVKPLKIGQKIKGYIKTIRDDGKLNLSLEPIGYTKVSGHSRMILKQLEQNDGYIPLSDKSPAEQIYKQFGISKKSFKMTIGALYKQRQIEIDKDGIRLKRES